MKTSTINENILPLIMILGFFIDGADKYLRSLQESRVGYIVKSILAFFLCVLIFYFYISQKKIKKPNRIIFLFFLLIVCLFSGFLFSSAWLSDEPFSSKIYASLRYFSGLIFVIFPLCFIQTKKVSDVFSLIFIVNCILAWIGFAFGIEILRTYGHIMDLDAGWVDQRFGYSGLIPEQNNASFFFLFGVANSYWRYKYLSKAPIELFFGIATCFILGTKAILLALFIFFVLIFAKSLAKKLLLSAVVIAVAFYAEINMGLSGLVTNEKIWNSALSGRLNFLFYKFFPLISSANSENIIFGFQGAKPQIYLIEMDFFDLVLFFGVVGALLYMAIIFMIFWERRGPTMWIPLAISTLAISFFSGHLFYDPTSMLYLSFIIACAGYFKIKDSERVKLL